MMYKFCLAKCLHKDIKIVYNLQINRLLVKFNDELESSRVHFSESAHLYTIACHLWAM